ncbi:CRISPR-associated endonuclease Cas1 [Capsulimonas corticalis]|uniref:CRISPR-associated endonuclease Cas1 n=1 Tax=Capsulimonas corticalis TaxID=2219043 RepID=UPI000FF99F7B|nr:CRISPR-associated endonuclease Cas1 [Capsulimonas corticalis]
MKNYYVLSNGRVRRESNTLYIETADGAKKPLPVEDVESLYVYGEVDINTKLLNFLSQKRIPLHVFNYHGFYSGSYYPREYLHSGYLLVQQVQHYQDAEKRLALAREIVRGSAHSLLRNIAYYDRRRPGTAAEREPEGEIGNAELPGDPETEAAVDAALDDPSVDTNFQADDDLDPLESSLTLNDDAPSLGQIRATVTALAALIGAQTHVNAVRGVEGKMRERYYQAWRHILSSEWLFERRVRRPPDNEVNALISFGNSVLYTTCLGEIYRTQLTPTISYVHEPGARRFSLALDLSEMFKPLIVDRAIFRLINTGQLDASHFDKSMDGCFLTDAGKRLFLRSLEDRLATIIKHRRLGRHVTYRHLIRLECYKLVRHLTDVEPYRAFRAWW